MMLKHHFVSYVTRECLFIDPFAIVALLLLLSIRYHVSSKMVISEKEREREKEIIIINNEKCEKKT